MWDHFSLRLHWSARRQLVHYGFVVDERRCGRGRVGEQSDDEKRPEGWSRTTRRLLGCTSA
eukprot:6212716-Pleurochrysis_carterae.AAC.4